MLDIVLDFYKIMLDIAKKEAKMDKYYDLEGSILSCLLLKSENMSKLVLEDKHFVKYKKIWAFMKEFYSKFHSFDIVLMHSVTNNKYQIVESVRLLLEKEPSANMFDEYQKQLLDLYNELKIEKYQIEKIFELANKLYVRQITVDEFDIKYQEMKVNVVEIFKEK